MQWSVISWKQEPYSTNGECENQAYIKDDVILGVVLNKCWCMHVKKVHIFIKWKKNEACEESHRNNDLWWKNRKNHVTLGKGNL